MNDRIKKYSEFLGMNLSTAGNKLKLSILFMLARKCQMDECFKCKNKIETAKELSVEHKEPWLYVSVDKFWDLNNIAFSHRKCNTPHRFNPRKRIPPEGKSWCYNCKDFKNLELFGTIKNKHGIRIPRNKCNPCRQSKNWDKK